MAWLSLGAWFVAMLGPLSLAPPAPPVRRLRRNRKPGPRI